METEKMESSSIDPLLLEDFGQKVDLTRRIREVLVNYPEGTTVLKELIQNADDAGATKVCLCLDRRSHGVDSLLSEKLAQWQGPALLAYNNAAFTEEDFVSISRIGGSKKQGQAWKTGRFGVGFNSVYHLTDLPSFVSGKYVVLFDPQGVYLPNVTAANPGKRLEYVSSSAISIYKDQFFPYCAFGCDMKSPFPGTLFRFPLRNADQAAVSKLSRQTYLEDDISSMFVQLYKEAVFTMLFLKNILSVEMYIWDTSVNEPQKLYSCSINLPNNDIVWHRQSLLRLSKSVKHADDEIDSFSIDFSSEAVVGTQLEKRVDTFFIVQAMASSSSKIGSFASAAANDYDLHLLPWASVAACISDSLTEADVLKQGRAFCFLPLPVRTGLTVQVNAYFEVSSNRRSIWFGADMDRGGKLRSDWNRLLLEDVVAPAFNKLLLGVRKLLGPTVLYYSLWPMGSFDEPWAILVEQIYRSIGNTPVFYSDIEGGKWISPAEAFLHDEEFTKSKELGEALVVLGMPIVHLPNTLVEMLFKYTVRLRQRVVSPATVRHYVKECEILTSLSRCHKLVLLEYCLLDLVDSDVGKHASGLALIPLASGEFGVFSEASKGITYFICNELEHRLLYQISDKTIDRDIPSSLFNRISAIAKSSKANISFFDVQCFLQLLPIFFPADWKYNNGVVWDPELNANHPTTSWFMLLWQYLRDQCDNLSRFGDWPILPSNSGHLYRASKYSKLMNAESLSDTMKGLLAKIGCKILNTNYGVEHRELSLYVHDGNGTGVLHAIFDVITPNENFLQTLFQNFEVDEKNELRQFLLDPKWYIGSNLSDSYIQNCKKLPIYKVYGGGSTQTFHFSDLEIPKKYLPPLDVPVYFLGGEFISSSSSTEEEILLRYYGIERMGKSHFYKENVLNRVCELEPQVRDSVMISILHDLPQLSMEDSAFRESLKKLEFVPTLGGTLKCPQALYDPRNEELYALLEDSDGFPCGVFQESGLLDMLLGLGLRSSVSPEAVIQSARQIELMMHKDPLKACSRGKVLLSYLEVNAAKWLSNSLNGERTMNKMFSKVTTAFVSQNISLETNLEKFWNDLRMICWCPVLVNSPYAALPWPFVTSMVAPPKLVRLPADLWLVSASMRILDGQCSSTALSCRLGWISAPGGSVIAAQLLELGKNNELVTDQVLRQELALAMPRIYSILTGMIGLDEMDIVKAVLEGCRWVWVGDGFATLDEVVLSGPLHLAPYIRVIPVDLAVFREFFLQLGIREFLKATDYANILCRMAATKGSTPLDAQELRAAVLVVQHLVEVHFQDQHVQFFLPDVSCRLFPSTDLVYNDAPWLLNSGDSMFGNTSVISLSAKKNVHKFVHGNISNDVAEKLGVLSLRRLLLAESADSMNLSLSGVAEAFGQHEALTTRLKHIVEMYADGPGILFELVQNADDAGASEVIFLLDKTYYGTSSVLSPEMADWQGPALYCFNSSVFSPQDLYAISRIGQDSKLEKPSAIGRFGLGFNCVYHFTDIPGFVSGENIVMFDPHACNLPGISPSHPGLRIKFVGRRILEQFPDQFAPFLQFGCDLQHPFPGTLFRFPLRSGNAALRSQIKKEKYAPEDVLSLFSSFSEVVSEALLFLRNVKTISIFVKDGAGLDMQLLHRVCKNNIGEPVNEPHSLHAMLDFIHGNSQSGMDREQFFNKLSKTVVKDLPWDCHKIVVKEQNSSGEKSHFWIISECIGGGCARSKSVGMNNRSRNFIPWACVAAYLHSISEKDVKEELSDDGQTAEGEPNNNILNHFQIHPDSRQHRREFEGRAFCFLPLPIATRLPTHVNAYFELSSNRRDIWFGNDMAGGGKVRSDWNIFLLEDVVAPAYCHLLAKVAAEIGPSDLFFSFWPTSTRMEPWSSMVRKLYLCIAERGFRILYTKARGGQWITTKQAIFPDFTFPQADQLIEALSDAGLPLVLVSKPVVEIFIETCPSLNFLTPKLLRTLLIRRKREFKNKDAMILTLEYCLSDVKGSIPVDSLNGLPLVPLANGLFTTFNKRGEGERIYVTCKNEYDLLKGSVPYLLIDCSIPEVLLKKLRDISQSGDSNISLLTCDSLEALFPRFLPVEWQHAKLVSWTPGYHGQPSLEWMGLLWDYLKSSCVDLSIFSKWPILPVRDDCLLQLVKNSNVIRDDRWSENMSSLLQKVGCCFLRSDLPIDHPQLKNFVQDASAIGVLNALIAISGDQLDIDVLFSDASEGEMHELRSYIFQSKWFHEDQMDSRHTDIIKLLPVFESYKNRRLTSLNKPIKWLKPEGVHDELLDENFVRTESEREKTILRCYLGIREPSRTEFYKDHVLNRMSEFFSQPPVLSAILLDVKQLIEEDTSIKDVFALTPFVLAADGHWRHPSRLYDPRVSGLQKLLHRKALFPCDKFSTTEILETLVSLGLNRTLGFTGLLDSARSVSMLHDSGSEEALNYGRRLLACLDVLGFKLSNGGGEEICRESSNSTTHPKSELDEVTDFIYSSNIHEENSCEWDAELQSCLGNVLHDNPEDEFWSELRIISWCPVFVDPPVDGLPWYLSKHHVASPSIVRPKSQMWMVSSMLRILDGECCSQYLQCKLGWMDRPNIGVLSTQLVQLSKSYCQLRLQFEEVHVLDAELQREIPSLYSKLQEFVGTDDFLILKSAVDGVSWVWIGDKFVSPKALAFDSPVMFDPYLYAVPSELSEFRVLLQVLGVRLTFDAVDYLHVLQRLQEDLKGLPLSPEQLSFVHRVLEAVVDCSADRPVSDSFMSSLLIPDSSGFLISAMDLVYNDAPWMEKNSLAVKHFVHPSISNDLANRLGVQSLRCLSLVDEEQTKDLPCMDYARIQELLAVYGDDNFLLFDLLELADCCKAKKIHFIFDKREHPRQSLLQHNLGEFQGPALTAVLEGAALSRDEVCSLQFLPPWRLRGTTVNYGLGLLSCYFISDLPSVVSSGYFYMFDPLGLALSAPSSHGPSAKMFSLIGTNLAERFVDQFHPMLTSQSISLSSSDSTVIRMPLSSDCMTGLESGYEKVKQIFERFMDHSSTALLFLKSILQVTLSTWEEGSLHPCQDYSVCVDPLSAVVRNPFSEKKWRKFQISRLFSSSSAAIKSHTVDIHIFRDGTEVIDKWLVVLCLGSGQTRNMALDRRYLAYNLTPVAGVAAHISRNGQPVSPHSSSCILSPLPLSGDISIPVTVLGCFLVCHNGGRYLFKHQNNMSSSELLPDVGNQLIEAWNRELTSCIRDSYIEMVLEFQKLRRDPLASSIELSSARVVSSILQAYADRIYSFWPRSKQYSLSCNQLDSVVNNSSSSREADWQCLVEQVIRPFYARLVDLPVWQLYCGNVVKADEGMFLAQSGNGIGDNLPPATVCSFIKEHYPVFSVPWELVNEIRAVGVTVREIKPKMVRDLLKASSTSIVLRSVETYIDVLEYCLCDIQLQHSSNLSNADTSGEVVNLDPVNNAHVPVDITMHRNRTPALNINVQGSHRVVTQSSDALEMMTSLGKALFDFGRVVVEDIGRAGAHKSTSSSSTDGQQLPSIAAELSGLPCPTATKHLARFGVTELWVGSKEQQLLMLPLAAKFIHSLCLERPILADFLSNHTIHRFLKLQSFSPYLLSNHLKLLFSEYWVNHVMDSKAPWVSWDNCTNSTDGGPSPEWIRLFWKSFSRSSSDLSIFSDWPFIPALLGRPILCRVKERFLVFIPPIAEPTLENEASISSNERSEMSSVSEEHISESELQPYLTSFEMIKSRYPWLFSLLNQFNIPVYDTSFLGSGLPCNCLPTPGQTLGQVIVSKLVAAKRAGYLSEPASFLNADRDELFTLFASDFSSNGSTYKSEEIDVLRDLPIYKTVVGTYTLLRGSDQCIISPNSFFQPYDGRCLSNSVDSIGRLLFHALGVPELNDQEILVRFALPEFEQKAKGEQEDILIYLYVNWQELQLDSAVVAALKETKFVRNGNEHCLELFKPRDLLDPCDSLLTSVFSGERNRFPGERFTSDGWLRVLRKTGLRTSLEADMILECARNVDLLGRQAIKGGEDPGDFETDFSDSHNEVSLKIWILAGSVVEAIFTNFAVLYGNHFCDQLSKIAFVPAEKGFPSIGGKKGGKRVLSSYSEAILLKDWPLAWSCAPILAKMNVIPPEYSWGALHLRSPPAFSTVLKHLQVVGRNGGEGTLAHWPTSSGMMTIEEASSEVLKYLDKNWESLSASDISELQKVAFVPVANGTRLVTANSLFVRLTVNLSPFAFELPTLYLPYVKILKDIGLQDVLSITCAKDLLLNIQRSCGYQRLNPNELRAVMEVLHFICDGSVQARSGGPDWLTEAIVPDDGCRLVLAKSCVYVDAYGSQLLRNIDTSMLRFAHPDLPEKICMALGIKKLSDIVVEELDHEQQLQGLGHIGSISLNMIKAKLMSRSLQAAVWTVLSNIIDSVPAFEGMTSEQMQSSLESIGEKLQFVQCLHTRFMLLPRSLDITRIRKESIISEWEGGSGHRTLYFLNRSRTCILIAEPPSYMSVFDVIPIVVSQVLGSPTVLPIGPLFSSPESSEKEILDMLRLGSDRGHCGRGGGSNSLVGKELFLQDAMLVQFHPLRPFYQGEIVAWRIGKDGEKLKYGRIPEDVRPSAGQALYRFTVETTLGEMQPLLSSQVFSFRSISMDDVASPSSLPNHSQTNVECMNHVQAVKDAGSSKTVSQQITQDLQYGRVSAEELVQAVRDMLFAAGINMDSEKQMLLQATLSLQEQLKESQAALLLEQEKADTAAKEADAAKAAWSCRVCLSAEVDVTIVPCGHVLCRRCSSAVSRCPFCRLQVSKTLKIFRP